MHHVRLLSMLLLGCGTSGGSTTVDATEEVSADAAIDAGTIDAPPTNTGSLAFDGTDDHVRITASETLRGFTAITLEAWVKPASTGAEMGIVGKTAGGPSQEYGLRRKSNDQAEATIRGPSSSCIAFGGSTIFVTGEWTHIAGTWSTQGGAPSVYLNGALVRTSTCTTSIVSTLNDLLIGAFIENDVVARPFHGLIDEVRLWGVVRTAVEIDAARTQRLLGSEPGLVGYWPFDDGSGDRATDATSNTNHGQLGTTAAADPADPAWSSERPF